MIGKQYSLGSTFENTGEARVKLANFEDLRGQSPEISEFLDGFTPNPGFMYLHVIAMGAGEYYGCNINGDYFPEKDLIARHNTFVTTAKVFKEHDNKPTSQDYGKVVFSWYNPKMHRVELILAIDKVKGAEFVRRQEAGEQLEVSMGCRVAYDVCSICGNKARRKSDYCSHIKYDKKKIYPDGKQPFMINYNPTFFDISIVRHRADRIAYVLSKVASASERSLQEENADFFENLGNAIPLAPETRVFDIEEDELLKTASEPVIDKTAMIKRISSNAVKVMNAGVSGLAPALRAQEPDLPVPLLDHLALNFSFPDILKSFFVNAMKLKPREATRIIIVQRGLPLGSFKEVLTGLNSATPAIDPGGEPRNQVSKLVEPFLIKRSSFLPAVMEGVEKLAALSVDIPNTVWSMDPKLTFGQVRNPEVYTNILGDQTPGTILIQKDPYAAVPVQITPTQYELEKRRPQLKGPMLSPTETGLALGALYAAYNNVPSIKQLLSDPKLVALLTAAAVLLHKKRGAPSPLVMQKQASIASWTVPFVGTHFLSAHYRNAYNNGAQLNDVERFVAENPDIISIAAPLAVNAALKKHAHVDKYLLKTAGDSEFNEKLAAFGDTVADVGTTLLNGIIFKGKRQSLASSVAGLAIDNALIDHAIKKN